MTEPERRLCWAVTVPGLEALAAMELRALGFSPRHEEPGGVEFDASPREVFLANLHLRTVTRVTVRFAEFHATSFHELERHARRIPWSSVIETGSSVALRVTCKKSRLYHSDAVGERVFEAIVRAVPTAKRATLSEDDEAETSTPQTFVVRFVRDVCTVSADSSGALLHRRGYRLATTKAPIRETLAAAVLRALGYDGGVPFLDPMCGSGTFAIESALIARGIAPGIGRRFACEQWSTATPAVFEGLRDAARMAALPSAAFPIHASDRDAGAIAAATANAARAEVKADIDFQQRSLSAIETQSTRGLLTVNPPYGDRVGDPEKLRDLYAQLGNVARARLPGWTVGMLSTDPSLEASTRLPFREVLRFKNGGIPVRLVQALARPDR